MIKKIKRILREIFAPRIVIHKHIYTSNISNDKNFPTKEFDSMFKNMGKMFENMGDMFKKL